MSQSFIEVQFPVSKLSKESYKDRKSNDADTLVALGKWHGRKPLVLVRAILLGLLMPATDDPKKDREIFLKAMTMDDEGMWRRCTGLSAKQVAKHLTEHECEEVFEPSTTKWKKGLTADKKRSVTKRAFLRMGYDERLENCLRPTQIEGPSPEAWKDINSHLGTSASTLPELIQELGKRRFGHVPVVGDAFAGGGSIPFEAAKLGCDVVANDLNPTAALMNYGALELIGGSPETLKRVQKVQEEVFALARNQIREWGIEINEDGWEAEAYLYCNEVLDPASGWRVPMLPHSIIDTSRKAIVKLIPDREHKRFDFEVVENASDAELKAAKLMKTADDGVISPVDREGNWLPETARVRTAASTLRGQAGLRMWDANEVVPRPDDVYQERVYCIRWALPNLEQLLCQEQLLQLDREENDSELRVLRRSIDSVLALLPSGSQKQVERVRKQRWPSGAKLLLDALAGANPVLVEEDADEDPESGLEADTNAIREARRSLSKEVREALSVARRQPTRVYRPPNEQDDARERLVLALLNDRLGDWKQQGFVPSRAIEDGASINRPIKSRGWKNWIQLFNPRMLLIAGCLAEAAEGVSTDLPEVAICLLAQMKLANWNSKLSVWNIAGGRGTQTFYAPALNTPMPNYACRASSHCWQVYRLSLNSRPVSGRPFFRLGDAAAIDRSADLWITDPGYGDMAPYAEFSEFFLAWIDKRLERAFPDWYSDSKRALAVELGGEKFGQLMLRCYRNLTEHMPDDGFQVVMFTQQDAKVWAEVTLVMWAAGLQVVQAWTVATESPAAARKGTYVQGTVCMVLKKRTTTEKADLAELMPYLQLEVQDQLKAMKELDDRESPNFTDSDYLLSAYVAALRILTSYAKVAEIDAERELSRSYAKGEESPVKVLIDQAVKVASDYLIPDGITGDVWRTCTPEERFYLKGVLTESHGETRAGVYQEFARGFGVREYRDLLQSDNANEARLKTPSEMKGRDLESGSMGGTLVRYLLYAIYQTASEQGNPEPALKWLLDKYPGTTFDDKKRAMLNILGFLVEAPGASMVHWKVDVESARIFRARLDNWGR